MKIYITKLNRGFIVTEFDPDKEFSPNGNKCIFNKDSEIYQYLSRQIGIVDWGEKREMKL